MLEGQDTIVAIATPSGQGGIGIVRLSGPDSSSISQKIFRPMAGESSSWPLRTLLFGKVVDPGTGVSIDEGFACRMEAPHSYTGEHTIELQLHGSPVVLGQVVDLCTCLGARLAAPGEFTKRAFLNGKMDLIQAEAVAELIHSRSDAEAAAARSRLEGGLSRRLEQLREATVNLLAECEADIDFPEEDLPEASWPHKLEQTEQLQIVTESILSGYRASRLLHEGVAVAIIGKPNVGKSSLFNALLTYPRAIVSEREGTTRDLLREELLLRGRRVRLIDTAGLSATRDDQVEAEGMARAKGEAHKADLVLFVLDGSQRVTAEDQAIANELGRQSVWLVRNKNDLELRADWTGEFSRRFDVSAATGFGIDLLREAMGEYAVELSCDGDCGSVANDRQKGLVEEYAGALRRVRSALAERRSADLIAVDLRAAHRFISRMIGRDEGSEEVLGAIFSRFCIGK